MIICLEMNRSLKAWLVLLILPTCFSFSGHVPTDLVISGDSLHFQKINPSIVFDWNGAPIEAVTDEICEAVRDTMVTLGTQLFFKDFEETCLDSQSLLSTVHPSFFSNQMGAKCYSRVSSALCGEGMVSTSSKYDETILTVALGTIYYCLTKKNLNEETSFNCQKYINQGSLQVPDSREFCINTDQMLDENSIEEDLDSNYADIDATHYLFSTEAHLFECQSIVLLYNYCVGSYRVFAPSKIEDCFEVEFGIYQNRQLQFFDAPTQDICLNIVLPFLSSMEISQVENWYKDLCNGVYPNYYNMIDQEIDENNKKKAELKDLYARIQDDDRGLSNFLEELEMMVTQWKEVAILWEGFADFIELFSTNLAFYQLSKETLVDAYDQFKSSLYSLYRISLDGRIYTRSVVFKKYTELAEMAKTTDFNNYMVLEGEADLREALEVFLNEVSLWAASGYSEFGAQSPTESLRSWMRSQQLNEMELMSQAFLELKNNMAEYLQALSDKLSQISKSNKQTLINIDTQIRQLADREEDLEIEKEILYAYEHVDDGF